MPLVGSGVLFRLLTQPKLGGSIGRFGLIIEPINLIRNQELAVSIPLWPPPSPAVAYELIYKGNDVYRIEGAALLSEAPFVGGDSPEIMNGTWHLRAALESLGVVKAGVWVGLHEFGEGDSARIVAWAVQSR